MKNNTIDLIKAGRLLVLKDIYAKHRGTVARIEAKASAKADLIKVIRVTVDGDDWGLYTPEAYQELQLGFSTGQFHTHEHVTEFVESFDGVTTLSDLNDEAGGL